MKKRQPRSAEARQEEAEPSSKRRRAVKEVTSAAQAKGDGALGRRRTGASTAAAAAGRAESDDDSSNGSSNGSGSGTEEDEEDDGQQEEGAGEAPVNRRTTSRDGTGPSSKVWHGVVSVRNSQQRPFRARVYGIGGAGPVEVGQHGSEEAAARVHDQAAIAVYGAKVAAGVLNFPASDYAGQQQLFGPALAARIEHLRDLGRQQLVKRSRKRGKLEGNALAQARANMAKAQAAFNAKLAPKRAMDALSAKVEEERRADPLWCPPKEPCGVCPACRQPWRTDLRGCLRLAAVKSERHSEVGVVQLLVTEPAMFRAVYGKQQKGRQQQQADLGEREAGGGARAPAGERRQPSQPAQQPQQQAGDAGTSGQPSRPGSPRIPPHELEWLQLPGKFPQLPAQQVQSAAMAPLRQQLAAHEAAFAEALQREQQPGLPAPAVPRTGTGTGPAGGSSGGGTGSQPTSSPAAAAAAAAAGTSQRAAMGGLDSSALAWVGPGSFLARGLAPHDTIHQADLEAMAQLAALCGEGGVEAPLVPELAGEALEAAEAQRLRQQRLVQRKLGRGRSGGDSSMVGGGSEEEGPVTAQDTEQNEQDAGAGYSGGEAAGNEQQLRTCQLCGGRPHTNGMHQCPVLQLALAVVKQPAECSACAHQEQPGCAQCLGVSSRRGHNFKPVLASSQPWARRAPWLDKVPPATQELMLAVQGAASAAVTDLDRPAAAWRLTPKALLAVGLLAEQAALRELAARQSRV